MKPTRILLLVLATAVLTSSCATHRLARRADDAVKLENWDQAVYYYLEALATDPGNSSLKMELLRARQRAGEQHFRLGKRFADLGELQRARMELELAVQLDPTHQYAEVELEKVRRDLAIASEEGGMAKLEAMKRAAGEMKVKPPVLNPASTEPLTLSFPNPTNIKDIYKAVGQAFGFNILFDPKLKDSRISVELRDVTARQALETLMQASGHFYKVLDEKSIIVVEDTPQNRRDYEDLVVKTFFLSNADVKDVNNMLRALIDARRIAVNEQLNSIVIRDTADKVAIAERLINASDKSKAEVLVDVELIQVDSTKLENIGVGLTSYSFPVTMDPSPITGSGTNYRIPFSRLSDITRGMWGVVVPNVAVNLVKSASEAETLAQPQLRMTEGEKGSLVIGDRVPIPTTTFNTTQTVGGNIVPITAFQYQDVGIKIDIEPRVHHNGEVTLKLKVEVSQLGEKVDVGGGNLQPKIGTRTIDSVIRLKDGETSLLAGLFRYDKTVGKSGVPWLADVPVIGGLFRSTTTDVLKKDLVLTLTPRIVRNPDITEEDLAPVWVGTENRITIFGNAPRVQSAAPGSPFDAPVQEPGLELDAPIEEPQPEGEMSPEEFQQEPPPAEEPPRLVFPQTQAPQSSDSSTIRPTGRTTGGTSPAAELSAATADRNQARLSNLAFFPARLPLAVGQEGQVTVMLEPGVGGVDGPLHLAYDPARIEVVRIEGGDLGVDGGNAGVQVGHTPALGWITASWKGTAVTSGTLVRLTLRPRETGELPLIFAGPTGLVTSTPATVVALPLAASGGSR